MTACLIAAGVFVAWIVTVALIRNDTAIRRAPFVLARMTAQMKRLAVGLQAIANAGITMTEAIENLQRALGRIR